MHNILPQLSMRFFQKKQIPVALYKTSVFSRYNNVSTLSSRKTGVMR